MERTYELQAKEKGATWIVGIDEVGRGCLFGDVVACAIVMPDTDPIEGVRDSKKLSEKKREILYEEILQKARAVGIGRVNAEMIDEMNIKEAARLAMQKAVLALRTPDGKHVPADFLLVDAEHVDLPISQEAIIHGDDLCYSVACASIVAKVFRDRLCLKWDRIYPGYGLAKHKGYGTKMHRYALKEKGPTPMHRKTFLKKILVCDE